MTDTARRLLEAAVAYRCDMETDGRFDSLIDAIDNHLAAHPEGVTVSDAQLRARVAGLEAALTYAITHEHDDDLEGTR